MEKNNLIRCEACFNPFYAIVNNKGYELNDIVIYGEQGEFYSSGCGWFRPTYGTDNPIKQGEGFYINNDIKKISVNHIEKNKQEKNNFIVNNSRTYDTTNTYKLYIYYKNIDCKFTCFKLTNFWLEYELELFNGRITTGETLGNRQKQSDAIKYNGEVKQAINDLNTYSIFDNEKKFKKNIITINNYYKKYKKAKEEEASYTLKDYKKMIYQHENFNALEKIDILEKTFNVKLGGNENE